MKKIKIDQKGQSLTEYLMLLILVSLGAMTATLGLGRTVISKISKANHRLSSINFEAVEKKGGSGGRDSGGSSMVDTVRDAIGVAPDVIEGAKGVIDLFRRK